MLEHLLYMGIKNEKYKGCQLVVPDHCPSLYPSKLMIITIGRTAV